MTATLLARRPLAASLAVIALAATAGTLAVATQPDDAPRGPVDLSAEAPPMEGVRLVTVLDGLTRPWGMVWLPEATFEDGDDPTTDTDADAADAPTSFDMLITERGGALRLVRDGILQTEPVPGAPEVFAGGQGGLLDISLHPDFADNGYVYLTYSIGDRSANRVAMGRGTFDGERLNDFQELFRNDRTKRGGQHFGSRILWLPDGTMLLSTGDGGNPPVRLDGEFIRNKAQDLGSHFGKVLRFNDDGTIPDDNPFVGRDGADPAVYSFGHRNIQGMALDPDTGRVWANEHGARGGDELNIVEPGKNYGWPEVTYSREYFGPRISPDTAAPQVVDPVVVWTPCIAPSGAAFYTGDQHPEWRGDLFNGALVLEHVRYVDLDEQGNVLDEREIRTGKRVRDVRQGPDGHLYIITDEPNGELIRIERTDQR